MLRRTIDSFKNATLSDRLMLLLALSLPFEYLPSLQLGSLNIRISSVVGGLLILVNAGRLYGLVRNQKLSLLEILLAAWLVWLAAGVVLGSDFHQGLVAFLPLLFLAVLALTLRVSMSRELLGRLIVWIAGGALLSILFGLYQFFGNLAGLSQSVTGLREQYGWQRFGWPRLQSVALEPLYFSAFLLLPFSLICSMLLRLRTMRRPAWLLILALIVLADMLSLSRGGLIAAALAALIIAAFNMSGWRLVARGLVLLAVVTAVVVSLVAVVAKQGEDPDVTYNKKGVGTLSAHIADVHFSPTTQNSKNDDSISQRQRARNQARRVVQDYPRVLFLGTGIGQYHSFASAHYQNPDEGEPNNVIIEQVVQTGLIGFGLLLAILVLLVGGLLRTAKNSTDKYVSSLSIGLLAFVLGIGLQAQTFTGLIITPLWFAVGLALFLVQLHPSNHKPIKRYATKKIPKSRTRPNR